MGITRATARLMLDEHRRQPFSGSVMELGRMYIHFSDKDLAEWAHEQKAPLKPVSSIQLSHNPDLADLGCMDDISFFKRLGFSDVTSCDYSDWEDCSIVIDLNKPVPEHLKGKFDAVVESGTMQHVFNIPTVLRNIHDMLKVGGRVIHGMVPSNNHVDHGFYMFSPTLFHDWYTANGYRLEHLYICEFVPIYYRLQCVSGPWRIHRYTPGSLDRLSYGLMGRRQLVIFCIATKTATSTGDVNPMQGAYVDAWSQAGTETKTGVRWVPPRDRIRHKDIAGRLGPFRPSYLRLRRAWKTALRLFPRRMPPVVARY